MTSISEHRLIRVTLDQLNKQRKQAGVTTPVVAQNARSTAAAAQVQEQARALSKAASVAQFNDPNRVNDLGTTAKQTAAQLASNANADGTAKSLDQIQQDAVSLMNMQSRLDANNRVTNDLRTAAMDTGAQTFVSNRDLTLQNAQSGNPTVMTQTPTSQTFGTQYVDPRNPTGYVPEGANVGAARFNTQAAKVAQRKADRVAASLMPDQVQKAKDAEYQAKRKEILAKASTEAEAAHAAGVPATDIYAKYNAELAALDSQKTQEDAQRQQNTTVMTQADRQTQPGVPNPMESIIPQPQSTQTINQLLQAVQGDPFLASAYMPTVSTLQNRAQILEQQRNTAILNAQAAPAFLQMLSSDLTFQQQALQQGRAIAEKDQQLQIDAANEVKNIMDLQEQRDNMARIRDETTLAQQNQEAEIRNRRIVNATGMDTDSQSLQFLESERQKGEQLLRDLREEHRLDAAIANAKIAITYQGAVNDAISTYNSKDLQLQSAYQSAKKDIMDTFNMDKKERRDAIQKAQDAYFTGMMKVDDDLAAMYKDARTEAEKNRDQAREESIKTQQRADDKQFELYKLGLNQDFEWSKFGLEQQQHNDEKARATMFQEMNRLNTRLNNDYILKAYNDEKMKFNTIMADYDRVMGEYDMYKKGEIDKIGMNTVDQGLINGLNKMWDENSVVREGEYKRTGDNMSMQERISAWRSRLTKGGVLSDDERKNVKEALDAMYGVWTSAAETAIQKFHLQINKTNSTLPPEYWLAPEDFGLSDIVGQRSSAPTYNNSSIQNLLRGQTGNVGGQPPLSITQEFGDSKMAYASGHHSGIDIAGPEGSRIPAMVSGVASVKQDPKGYGNYVSIKTNDGHEVILGHLGHALVKDGQRVTPQTKVGFMGHTGYTNRDVEKGGKRTGTHLHLEVRKNGKAINPRTYFSRYT